MHKLFTIATFQREKHTKYSEYKTFKWYLRMGVIQSIRNTVYQRCYASLVKCNICFLHCVFLQKDFFYHIYKLTLIVTLDVPTSTGIGAVITPFSSIVNVTLQRYFPNFDSVSYIAHSNIYYIIIFRYESISHSIKCIIIFRFDNISHSTKCI